MASRRPVFRGDSEIDQLFRIFRHVKSFLYSFEVLNFIWGFWTVTFYIHTTTTTSVLQLSGLCPGLPGELVPEHTHTHTTVLLLVWNMSGSTRVSRYQKGKTKKVKTNLEQEIVSGSGICWAICKSAPHADNHANIPPLSFFYRLDALPDAQPTASKHWRNKLVPEPIWILLKQETVSGSGIRWAICKKSASRSRQIIMPARHHAIFYRLDVLHATQPTASKLWRQTFLYTLCPKKRRHQIHCHNSDLNRFSKFSQW